MPARRPLLLAPGALLLAGAFASPALADTTDPVGRAVELTVNAQGSDDFGRFRGELVVEAVGSGALTTYRWGGLACPGRDLSDANVSRLLTALENHDRLVVIPRHKPGQGSTKCLVSFTIQVRADRRDEVQVPVDGGSAGGGSKGNPKGGGKGKPTPRR